MHRFLAYLNDIAAAPGLSKTPRPVLKSWAGAQEIGAGMITLPCDTLPHSRFGVRGFIHVVRRERQILVARRGSLDPRFPGAQAMLSGTWI